MSLREDDCLVRIAFTARLRLTHFNGHDVPIRPTLPDLARRFGVRLAFGVILLRPSGKSVLREGQGDATSTVAERASVTSEFKSRGD